VKIIKEGVQIRQHKEDRTKKYLAKILKGMSEI
jgi:hypothetical protein